MRVLLLIASLLLPSCAICEPSSYERFLLEEENLQNRFENGVMHVNEREFLMGRLHDWPKANQDFRVWFMVRSSVWLRAFLDNDPVLKDQDFDIRRTLDSSFTGYQYLAHQMALQPDPPRDCDHCNYDLTLDPVLQVSGYDTYIDGYRSLLFLPRDSAVSHGYMCHLLPESPRAGELDACNVIVVYPYATNIVLNGYRYRPGTVAEYGPGFALIAARMLDVVMCIDITDQPMLRQTVDPSLLLQEHPDLSGCRPYMGG
ncbi:hypothetical protein [Loktanella sp. IMCC34160]|uniref:hypothetical protein n=1 Tax=Loktanella sp. IMCC34160 TaxID=2510646 RepID=UPI0013EC8731|nr:hypothetical protein [Loktanella sp. IMCC34160]